MTMDFSGTAGAGSDFDTIPKGQLAWAMLNVRGVKASGSGGGYLDCELTLCDGQPYAGRKVWEMIGDPNNAGNSEKYRQMGRIAITRILECGRGAGPHNPDGYKINNYAELSGLKVAIKIGVEPGEGGHDDKNRVADWLTPNPASQSGHKYFQKLVAGEYSPPSAQPAATGGFGGGAPTPQQQGGFGGGFGGGNANATANPPANGGFGAAVGNGSGPVATPGNGAGTVAGAGSDAPATSPSNPGATPNWLEQANGGAG